MIARSEKIENAEGSALWRQRLWRYGPLVLWLICIFFASTGELSSSQTSRIVRPLLLWLFPDISEERIAFAHFTEYAILALLAVRAFTGSTREALRRRWFVASLLLVFLYSLTDEFHQALVPTRRGSIYDSLIDTAGGLTALVACALRRKRKAIQDGN